MLDQNGEEMTEVGYTGDPFRVSIYETNGMFINAPEITFTPGYFNSWVAILTIIRFWCGRFQWSSPPEHWLLPAHCVPDLFWN